MDEGDCRDVASLSEEALWRGHRGGGELLHWGHERYVKKGSRYWHLSPSGPLDDLREPGIWRGGGGSYTGNFER